jgi:hypothetical protein
MSLGRWPNSVRTGSASKRSGPITRGRRPRRPPTRPGGSAGRGLAGAAFESAAHAQDQANVAVELTRTGASPLPREPPTGRGHRLDAHPARVSPYRIHVEKIRLKPGIPTGACGGLGVASRINLHGVAPLCLAIEKLMRRWEAARPPTMVCRGGKAASIRATRSRTTPRTRIPAGHILKERVLGAQMAEVEVDTRRAR